MMSQEKPSIFQHFQKTMKTWQSHLGLHTPFCFTIRIRFFLSPTFFLRITSWGFPCWITALSLASQGNIKSTANCAKTMTCRKLAQKIENRL